MPFILVIGNTFEYLYKHNNRIFVCYMISYDIVHHILSIYLPTYSPIPLKYLGASVINKIYIHSKVWKILLWVANGNFSHKKCHWWKVAMCLHLYAKEAGKCSLGVYPGRENRYEHLASLAILVFPYSNGFEKV